MWWKVMQTPKDLRNGRGKGKLVWAEVWRVRYVGLLLQTRVMSTSFSQFWRENRSIRRDYDPVNWYRFSTDWTGLAHTWHCISYFQHWQDDRRDGDQDEKPFARGQLPVIKPLSLFNSSIGLLWQDARHRLWPSQYWWSWKSQASEGVAKRTCGFHQTMMRSRSPQLDDIAATRVFLWRILRNARWTETVLGFIIYMTVNVTNENWMWY